MTVPGQMKVGATGAFSYMIPLVVPPGTAGMVPDVALEYSSHGGDGIVGIGWSLSITPYSAKPMEQKIGSKNTDDMGSGGQPMMSVSSNGTFQSFEPMATEPSMHADLGGGMPTITRCPRTLAQDNIHGGVNFNMSDRFCLDGARLVLIGGTYGGDGSEYRTEVESFSKIVAHGTAGNGPAWFEVRTKSGLHMEFGNTQDSKVPVVPVSGSVAPPAGTVRAWQVNRVSDSTNNYFTIAYTNGVQDLTNGQSYPTSISYTGNSNSAVNLAPYNSIQFVYTNRPSSDIVPSYQAGSLQQTTVLLTDIKTYAGTALVSDYKLAYSQGSAGLSHDRLTSVSRCDPAGACLAQNTFGWQGDTGLPQMTGITDSYGMGNFTAFAGGDFNHDGLTDVCLPQTAAGTAVIQLGTVAATSFTPSSYVSPCGSQSQVPLDFNADGYADVSNGGYFYFNNQAGGWNQLDASSQLGGGTAHTVSGPDFNGDGIPDVYRYPYTSTDLPNGISLYYGTGSTAAVPNGQFVAGPHYAQGIYTNPLAADFDGDGCADILTQPRSQLTNTSMVMYSCAPATTSIVAPPTPPQGRSWATVVGDFNGDGKADILYVNTSGSPSYATPGLYLSTGTGFVATNFVVPSNWCPGCFPYYEIVTGDWNGDGKTDIALVPGSPMNTTVLVFLSTGTGFVQEASIPNIGQDCSGIQKVYPGDWNSDGASDLWFTPCAGDIRYLFSHVPELMTSVSNGIGSTITVSYDRLNKNGSLYTVGTTSTYPTEDVDGPLYVVSRIDASNGIGGNYSSTYAYAGAKSDLHGRGSLGFSSVKITDLQTNIVQTTNYRTDFPFVGQTASQTKTHGTVTLNSTTNTYADTSPGASTDGVARHFVSLTQSVVAQTDLDGSALPTVTTNFTYDAYGNPTTVAQSVSDGSSKTVTDTYTNDTVNWLLGQLTSSNVQSIVGTSNLTRHFSFVHDAASGLVTQETAEPAATDNTYLATAFAYDAFGNRTSATTSTYANAYGAARTSSVTYDAKGQYPTSVTNALGQAASVSYDARFGEIASQTDPNGLTTTETYDTFGRQTQEVRPDGNSTIFNNYYCNGVNGGVAGCEVLGAITTRSNTYRSDGVTQAAPATQVDYDALGRVVMTYVQGFDGNNVEVWTKYDANGRVSQKSRPFFGYLSNMKWTVFAYDDLGRVTSATAPNGGVTTTAYHGLSVTVTDPLGHATTTVKNAQGLAASVTDALAHATSYAYDSFGDLTKVTDAAGNVTSNAFDLRGRKTQSTDPDMGTWSYAYDGFGELTSQQDAKLQTTTLAYDLLGRVVSRSEPDLSSTWTWGTSAAAHNIGALASATTGAGYTRSLAYDSLGRPSSTTLTIAGTAYSYGAAYNADGRVDTVSYPSGLALKYAYTSLGYLSQVKDNASGTAYWTANTMDAELHVTSQTFGNGASETASFDANTGLVTQILAGTANSIASFSYGWDTVGNLVSRADTYQGYTENFCYDALNRLTNYSLGGTSCTTGTAGLVKSVGYDAIGNILTKSDLGSYAYPAAGTAHPHAVSSITGTVNGVINPAFAYDADGNMTSGAGRTVSWTSFNLANQVTQGTTTVAFAYDSEHNRITQSIGGASPSATTYLNALGAVSEKFVAGATTTWHDYIEAEGKIVAEKFSGTTNAVRYFVLDHLGSVAVITDETGAVTERLSYDAWGQRRCANATGDVSCFAGSATTRGFTNQEEIDQVGLVNLNARIYDPVLGRFMSPDPTIQSIFVPQELNRYTYVLNNPLSFIDPTGLTCSSTSGDKGFTCQVDKILDQNGKELTRKQLTPKQLKELETFEAAYTKAVNNLASNPDQLAKISLATIGPNGKPTNQTRSVTVRAGDVAKALINRIFVDVPFGSQFPQYNCSAACTFGNTTVVGPVGLSGNGTAQGVPRGNADLLRQVEVVHEGLHGTATHTDDYLAPGGSNQIGVEPLQGLHQRPFNDAALDLLAIPH